MLDSLKNPRQQRGLDIAKTARISKLNDKFWTVPSQTKATKYLVDPLEGTCACADHQSSGEKCKHLWAVACATRQVLHPNGSVVMSELPPISYSQNWFAYNQAQTREKEHFQKLLKGLCSGIPSPKQVGRGRPRLPVAEAVYSCVVKVWSGLSGRRATPDLRICENLGLLDHAPHYNSISAYLEKPELTRLLTTLVEESAAPFAAIERSFSPDSTGFSTSVYHRWFDNKYGRAMKEQRFINAHVMVGNKSNVVTAIKALSPVNRFVRHAFCELNLACREPTTRPNRTTTLSTIMRPRRRDTRPAPRRAEISGGGTPRQRSTHLGQTALAISAINDDRSRRRKT